MTLSTTTRASDLKLIDRVIEAELLVARPFTLRLSRGVMGGEVRVDQRQGQRAPTITLALDLRGSSIDALAGGIGTAAPVLVDTSESQARGVGSITFPEERIA